MKKVLLVSLVVISLFNVSCGDKKDPILEKAEASTKMLETFQNSDLNYWYFPGDIKPEMDVFLSTMKDTTKTKQDVLLAYSVLKTKRKQLDEEWNSNEHSLAEMKAMQAVYHTKEMILAKKQDSETFIITITKK